MSRELKNKPLVEAIFELRWELQEVSGRRIDPYYPIMLGEFFAAVKVTARFNQGEKNDQPGLIWDTQIQSSGDDAPGEQSAIEQWLEAAHTTTSDWFSRQIEGDLLEVYR